MGSSRFTDKDTGWKKFKKRLRVLDGHEVVVGITAEKGEESAEPKEAGLSLITLATVHEFGFPELGIPRRSFLADTFDINERKYDKIMSKGIAGVVSKKDDPRKKLFVLGQTARTDVLDRFDAGIGKELKDATKKRKGSSKQLVNTSTLKNSIQSVVRKATA